MQARANLPHWHETTGAGQVKFTNRRNLHPAIVEAVTQDPYHAGDCDITVTQLIGPPQIRYLARKHHDELVDDVSDRIWSLLGQAIHVILERAGTGDIREGRLYANLSGWRIGGQMDSYSFAEKKLSDYKFTTVWSVIFGKPEWEWQLNAYAWLLRQNGYDVREAEIVAILRDWSRRKARFESNYPADPVVQIPMPLWDQEKLDRYLRYRIWVHRRGDGIECSEQERWYQGTKVAVVKNGCTRASRVLDTREQAMEWAWQKGLVQDPKAGEIPGYSFEDRPGANVRCEDYCLVAQFCEQWKRLQSQSAATG
jgi:hypothetical protein